MAIDVILNNANYITICVSFLLSITLTRNKSKGDFIRLFPFYHGSSVITEVIATQYLSSDVLPLLTWSMPYNLFTVFEFLFFSFYIRSVLQSGRWIVLTTVVCFLIIMSIFVKEFGFLQPPNLSLLVQNFFLIISCFVYFNDVFTSFAEPNLSKQAAFWIVIGIMYYAIITTPFLIFDLTKRTDKSFGSLLYPVINSTAYILMYSLFMKAYSCKQGLHSRSSNSINRIASNKAGLKVINSKRSDE